MQTINKNPQSLKIITGFLCFFVPPVGILLLWTAKPFDLKTTRALTIIVSAWCLLMIAAQINKSNDPNSDLAPEKTEAQMIDMFKLSTRSIEYAVIEPQLKAPKTAEFGSSRECVKVSSDQYMVKNYVDSQNSFGAMLRTNFIITFTYKGSGSYSDDKSWNYKVDFEDN